LKSYSLTIFCCIKNSVVIDPACGSGAFPIGALQKIVFILQQIDPQGQLWFKAQLQNVPIELRRTLERENKEQNFDYIRKLGIIRENIYGIDIQPIATEISRLRCFLTLIVDQKVDDQKENRGIDPLPNLDFKFVTANSLIGLPKLEVNGQKGMFEDEIGIQKLRDIRDRFFNASVFEREQLKLEFVKMQKDMSNQLRTSSKSGLAKLTETLIAWDPFSHKPSEWFDMEWMFGIKEGFDIVIANPPYVRQEKFASIKNVLKKKFGSFYNGRADLYIYFIKLGFSIIKHKGIFSYITSNKFFKRGYGKNTRSFLTKNVSVARIINFGELPVFKASVDSAIIIAKNIKPNKDDVLEYIQIKNENDIINISRFFDKNKCDISVNSLGADEWSLEDKDKIKILNKMKNLPNTLGSYLKDIIFAGIKTGYDEAFVINEEKKDILIREDPKSSDLIKPWLRGKDNRKWQIAYKNLYIIYIPLNKIKIDNYPAIKKHLLHFKTKLEKRATSQRWYEMQQPQESFSNFFDRPKVIYPDCAKEMRASYDETGAYGTMAMYFIPFDPLILGILNSKLFDWYSRMTFATFGDPWNGGRIIFKTIYMSKVPIPDIKNDIVSNIKKTTEKILTNIQSVDYSQNLNKQTNVKEYEKQIDELVYKLYGLTEDEVKIIEEGVSN